MLKEFSSVLPDDQKKMYLNRVIKSGKGVPTRKVILSGEKLIKITPKGNKAGLSPFYMTEEEFLKWKGSGEHPGQVFGLPLENQASEYSVHVATANQQINVFESVVAETQQANFITTGGGKQILILDLDKWSVESL